MKRWAVILLAGMAAVAVIAGAAGGAGHAAAAARRRKLFNSGSGADPKAAVAQSGSVVLESAAAGRQGGPGYNAAGDALAGAKPAPTASPAAAAAAAGANAANAAPPAATAQSGRAASQATVDVDFDSRELPLIPKSFMGISHEWPFAEEMAEQPRYMELMRWLSSFGGGPLVVRIGGGSTDLQTFVPPQRVWDSLAKLQKGTGAKFIIGLNLEAANKTLALAQMRAAQASLPAGSIMNFEIGNEPNFFNNKFNGTAYNSGEAYIACCYHDEWKSMAASLACPADGSSPCSQSGQFAGPAWGHVNVRNTTIDWFLTVNSQYVGLVTVHWYKAKKEAYNDAFTLLEEAPVRKEMANLKSLVNVSRAYGKPLRVAEMNTISNSGRDGVSNVFAAALWSLDGAFEVAKAGAVGVNFHQGAGQNLYSALVRTYNAQNNMLNPVNIRAPFYGMALFQQAVGSSAQMLPADLSGDSDGLKAWPLWNGDAKQLRVVLINKRADAPIDVTLRLNKPGGFGAASVSRLVAAGDTPLQAQTGITLGGITFVPTTGEMVGKAASEAVPRSTAGGSLSWRIYMPKASAALVTIPKY